MNPPTAPFSIREIVNEFLNNMEELHYTALLFRMDYQSEDDDFESGSLALTEYGTFRQEDALPDAEAAHQMIMGIGNIAARLQEFERPCLLRISEKQLPPLGVWLWVFVDDTLSYVGE